MHQTTLNVVLMFELRTKTLLNHINESTSALGIAPGFPTAQLMLYSSFRQSSKHVRMLSLNIYLLLKSGVCLFWPCVVPSYAHFKNGRLVSSEQTWVLTDTDVLFNLGDSQKHIFCLFSFYLFYVFYFHFMSGLWVFLGRCLLWSSGWAYYASLFNFF